MMIEEGAHVHVRANARSPAPSLWPLRVRHENCLQLGVLGQSSRLCIHIGALGMDRMSHISPETVVGGEADGV